jgi:hypothetical protein
METRRARMSQPSGMSMEPSRTFRPAHTRISRPRRSLPAGNNAKLKSQPQPPPQPHPMANLLPPGPCRPPAPNDGQTVYLLPGLSQANPHSFPGRSRPPVHNGIYTFTEMPSCRADHRHHDSATRCLAHFWEVQGSILESAEGRPYSSFSGALKFPSRRTWLCTFSGTRTVLTYRRQAWSCRQPATLRKPVHHRTTAGRYRLHADTVGEYLCLGVAHGAADW